MALAKRREFGETHGVQSELVACRFRGPFAQSQSVDGSALPAPPKQAHRCSGPPRRKSIILPMVRKRNYLAFLGEPQFPQINTRTHMRAIIDRPLQSPGIRMASASPCVHRTDRRNIRLSCNTIGWRA